MSNIFFELLQVSLGTRDKLSRMPSAAEWGRLFGEAERQAVAGLMLGGLERMLKTDDIHPPKSVISVHFFCLTCLMALQI